MKPQPSFTTQNQMSLGAPPSGQGFMMPWGNSAMFNMPQQQMQQPMQPVAMAPQPMPAQAPMQQAPQESPLKRGMLAAPPAENYPVFDRSGLTDMGFSNYMGMSNIGFPGYNRGGRSPFQLRGRMTEPMVFA